MQVILCISDPTELQFCRTRLDELAKQSGESVFVVEQHTVNAVLFLLEDLKQFDLIYIGIHEPDLDGMALAAALRNDGVTADIVFFTRDERRIADAFDVEALHYLVPGKISVRKFDEVFRKALARSKRRNSDSIVFSCAGEWRRAAIAEIRYFEVNNRILTVHYANTSFEFYSTLTRVEEKLYGRGFIRIHRSLLVAGSCISAVTKDEVLLTDGTALPIGRQYAENLRAFAEERAVS